VTIARHLVLVLSAMLLCATSAAAASDTSSSKGAGSWFGFGGDSSKPAAKTKKVSNASKTPPVLTKMADAPKRLVSSTKSMLAPKNPSPKKKGPETTLPPVRNPKEQKQGFFQSLFNPAPPPPPQTIQDWMKLKQIHP
jgi:hypothetical protein